MLTPRVLPPTPIEQTRVIAIIRGLDPASALSCARALTDGGIRAIEVTLNTNDALVSIERLRSRLPGAVVVGAGTVLDVAGAAAAIEAGAEFFVSPHVDVELIDYFRTKGLPSFPGAQSPTEIATAWRAGATAVKLFPAGPLGATYLREIRGPFNEVPFIATGGITIENAPSFIAAGAWALGMGTALAESSLVRARDWNGIAARARSALMVVAGVGDVGP